MHQAATTSPPPFSCVPQNRSIAALLPRGRQQGAGGGTAIGQIDEQPRLAMQFTCTVCDTRSTKTFTKHSYEKGVVIIVCPECKNMHLVADNLGWFSEDGSNVNIEDIMREQGQEVSKGGTIEFDNYTIVPPDE
eukprot:gene10980-30043_t